MASIYIPYYDNGSFHIQEADAQTARKIGHGVNSFWLWRGMVYGPNAYTTELGAQNYIDKRYNEAKQYLYEEVTQ